MSMLRPESVTRMVDSGDGRRFGLKSEWAARCPPGCRARVRVGAVADGGRGSCSLFAGRFAASVFQDSVLMFRAKRARCHYLAAMPMPASAGLTGKCQTARLKTLPVKTLPGPPAGRH